MMGFAILFFKGKKKGSRKRKRVEKLNIF